MVQDYVQQLYAPAADSTRRVAEADYAGARALAAWRSKVEHLWPRVRVEHVESTGVDDVPELGQMMALRAIVQIDGLDPEDVDVQAAYGHVEETEEIVDPTVVAMDLVERAEGGLLRYETKLPLRRTGPYGYTVRVLPRHTLLATGAELGLIALP
jgi:starch phosphorylase